MGVTLTSKTIKSTYQGLLKLSDNNSLNTVYKIVTDGFGNDSALRVSSIAVSAVKLYSEMDSVDIAGDTNGSVVVTRDYITSLNLGSGSGLVDSVNSLTGAVQVDLGFDQATSTVTLTGGASADLSLLGNYVHDQGVAAATWSIAHGLGKYPSVMVVDSANSVVVGEIEYTDTNNIVITFNAGFSGHAYLN